MKFPYQLSIVALLAIQSIGCIPAKFTQEEPQVQEKKVSFVAPVAMAMPSDQQINEIKEFFQGKNSKIEEIHGLDLVLSGSSLTNIQRAKKEAELKSKYPEDYQIVMDLKRKCLPLRVDSKSDATFPINNDSDVGTFDTLRSGDKFQVSYGANLNNRECPLELALEFGAELLATDKKEGEKEGKFNGNYGAKYGISIRDEALASRVKMRGFEISTMINLDTFSQVVNNGVTQSGYVKGSFGGSFINLVSRLNFSTEIEASGSASEHEFVQTTVIDLVYGKTTLVAHTSVKEKQTTIEYFLNGNPVSLQKIKELFGSEQVAQVGSSSVTNMVP